MKGVLSICLPLVLVLAVLVGIVASGGDFRPQSDNDGMEFEAIVEAVTSADGLRTVVTAAPTSSFEPVRGFVVQNGTPSPVSYSGSAHVRFKPGVLTIALRDGRAWQFVVERADPRFRREERIRVELPVHGAAAFACALPSARLLDRAGRALAVPVAAFSGGEAATGFLVAELALAPLAPGDYLIELTTGDPALEGPFLVAFRIVP